MVKWVPMFRTHFSQQTADTKQQTATFTQCFKVEISVSIMKNEILPALTFWKRLGVVTKCVLNHK